VAFGEAWSGHPRIGSRWFVIYEVKAIAAPIGQQRPARMRLNFTGYDTGNVRYNCVSEVYVNLIFELDCAFHSA
jgi:hypothetical protein